MTEQGFKKAQLILCAMAIGIGVARIFGLFHASIVDMISVFFWGKPLLVPVAQGMGLTSLTEGALLNLINGLAWMVALMLVVVIVLILTPLNESKE